MRQHVSADRRDFGRREIRLVEDQQFHQHSLAALQSKLCRTSQVRAQRLEFPRDAMPGAAPGVQIKLEGVLAEERYERWLVCEDLAQQLVPIAKKDEAAHPEHGTEQTLEHVCAAVASKAWVSPKELDWLMQRLRTLLELD